MTASIARIRFFIHLAMCYAVMMAASLSAQNLPEFNMSDTTITICIGILYDSGGEDGLYNNNENITTVIETGGIITLTFQGVFNVENNLDVLTIYDGPNTASPLLGIFTGTNLPPSLTANSGAVTLVFTSDNSAIYAGFEMMWESDNPPPVPPALSVNAAPLCNSNNVLVALSTPVRCEWLTTAIWTITTDGQDVAIGSVNPNCVNGETNGVTLSLANPFTFNCNYDIELIIQIPDDCGLIYIFTLTTSFLQDNCGISANLVSSDNSICPGSCANLSAQVQGCLGYSFEWTNNLPATAGPHSVCPDSTTTYSVTITENQTGNTTVLAYTLLVLDVGINTADQTLCQSEPLLLLDADVPGLWSGPGIMDEELGWFEPDSANAGLNIIYFETALCLDSIQLTIIPISTNDITAACPGSSPFQLTSTPAGGIWDGPFTTPGGIFDPSTEGSYIITYTTAQCSDTLLVNVAIIEGVATLDTICQSVPFDTIVFSPLGGYWSGFGIVDSLLGIYEPSEMPPGWVNLLYTINGCNQEFEVFIKEIDIGPGFTSTCPVQAPMVFYDTAPIPEGGYWSGTGIINPVSGLFDPGLIPNDSYTSIIYYAPNGCSDTTYIYNRQTIIELDQLELCDSDPAYELIRENIGHSPHYGGEWTGPGLSNPDWDYWLFDPAEAGVGIHTLVYLKNECSDSLIVTVYPSELTTTQQAFCSTEEPVIIESGLPSGGLWYGSGITDSAIGLFDPGQASEGSYYVHWVTQAGCRDSVLVEIEAAQIASISGLAEVYCFSSTPISVNITPVNAITTGPVLDGSFISSEAGEGVFVITASWTGNQCSSFASDTVTVLPPIITTIDVTDPVICGGSAAVITVSAQGGNPDFLFSYAWSDNSFPINTNTVSPESSEMIYVTTSDGCSNPAIDSVFIQVLPPIEFVVSTSELQCYGDEGFAAVEIISSGTFETIWGDTIASSIIAPAGTSQVLQINDLEQGCTRDTLVLIPNFPPVTAAFSFNPNSDCIPNADAENVSIIDLSQNAITGTWDFGNGETAPYDPGTTPQPNYPGSGEYIISLVVYNIGNCESSTSSPLCVLPATPIFIPDIFSPNGDDANDVLYVRSQGIVSMVFVVYNRWGEKVFESDQIAHGWDGQHRGKPSPSGNYFYYLQASLNDGSTEEMSGEISLIR